MSSHGANAYYPWFVRDYRSSRKVQRMGWAARGFYRELLDEEFLEGSLPTDITALADICGCPVKVMEKAWHEIRPCFDEVDGRLVNAKLEEIRTERDQIRVKRAEAGRRGGIAKQLLANAKQKPYSRAKQSREEQDATASASPSSLESQIRPDEFLSAWNEHRGELPRVLGLSEGRRRKIQTRVREGLTVERFTEAVKVSAVTPFLRGNNQRKWRANFDWLLENDSNLLKVLEGKYADGDASVPESGTHPDSFALEASAESPHPSRVIGLDSIRAKAGIQ
jgi:uncharacterized protein YdaU (DUF1376 family)